MSAWTLTSGATTQPFAAWGFEGLRRSAKTTAVGKVSFKAKGAKVDDTPALADKSWITIQQDSAPWFAGLVTRTPRSATSKGESIGYEISDPWWYFENSVFQQQWVTTDTSGGATTTLTTTRSRILLSQSLDGVKMDLGMVMREVIYYVLYAAAGLAFPATVDGTTHICPPPTYPGGFTPPFTLGTLTPTITIPYAEVTDKTCAEIIKLLMRWVPDATQWFDYSAAVPVLNIAQRATQTARAISLFGGTIVNPNSFEPTPRTDLVVPAVIVKYEEVNSVDGVSYDNLTVDKFPLDAADNALGAMVVTVDLVGGSATYQHQDVKATERPTVVASAVMISWLTRKMSWLFGTTSSPSPYDFAHVSVTGLTTDLDPASPYATDPDSAPTGFSVDACVNELLPGGAIAPWMTDQFGIFAAKLLIAVTTTYTNSGATADPATAALFQGQGNGIPGTRTDVFGLVCTNASSETYKGLTSLQGSEPVPVGLAQTLYNALSVLHWEGAIMFKEQECSGQLAIGCVFNTNDGRAEWAAMNALVVSVDEDIDKGATTVKFGPPPQLSAGELTELLRAARGRVFSFKLDQRTTGQAGTANAVIGHTHSAENTTSSPPGSATIQAGPFVVTTRPSATGASGTFEAKVTVNGVLQASPSPGDYIAIDNLGQWFNLNANDTIWLYAAVAYYAVSGNAAIRSYGNGNMDYLPASGPFTAGGVVEGDTNNTQTLFRKPVVSFIADANGKPSLGTIYTNTSLVIKSTTFGTFPAIYPCPL